MRRLAALALLCVLPACALRAQSQPRSPGDAVATTRELWRQTSAFITEAAEDMPEAKYGYKPTPEVRSFGELVAHVAGSQYTFCAAAMGDSARAEDAIEKTEKAKADLVAAMKASNDYCARAYQQSDAVAGDKTKVFGQERTRLSVLMNNATHDAEHYGNIVTYLRMNGMVPPSSKPQQ